MIKGELIYLRPIERKDLKKLNDWKNDEDVYRYLGGGFMPVSIDQQEKWLDTIIDLQQNDKRFIICNYEDTAIGMIGLYDIKWIHRTCEIGVFIGDKTFHGNGYGKEACELIENFAKNYLNIRKIKLSAVINNEKALNMWISLGYKKVGELFDERFILGKYLNVAIMEKKI